MKKFYIFLSSTLFIFAIILIINQNRDQQTLSYEIAEPDERTCYIDLAKNAYETCIPHPGYFFEGWLSHEKAILIQSLYSSSSIVNEEYYLLDLKTNSLECITCKIQKLGHKLLSPLRRKVAIKQNENLVIVNLDNPTDVNAQQFDINVSQWDWASDEKFMILVDQDEYIYRVDIDSQSLSELPYDISAKQIFDLQISPDDSQVAFYILDHNNQLFLAGMHVDGTKFRILIDLTPTLRKVHNSENAGTTFTWSPTGKQIAYTREIENPEQISNKDGIYAFDLIKNNIILIDDSPTVKWSLTWSPDGSYIAFSGKTHGGLSDVWTVMSDGSRLTNITNSPQRGEYGVRWK